jgi:hypothetical protein
MPANQSGCGAWVRGRSYVSIDAARDFAHKSVRATQAAETKRPRRNREAELLEVEVSYWKLNACTSGLLLLPITWNEPMKPELTLVKSVVKPS